MGKKAETDTKVDPSELVRIAAQVAIKGLTLQHPRGSEWRDASAPNGISTSCFVGTPGDLKVTARYSGRMYAMSLLVDDIVNENGHVVFWYTGGPGDLEIRYGSARAGGSAKLAKQRAAREATK